VAVHEGIGGILGHDAMSTHDELVANLRDLEESLWREETRFDRAYMGSVLAPEFVEFGRSGRRYDRDAVLADEYGPIGALLPLEGFTVMLVRPDLALVTYVNEDHADGYRRSNRMSLWDRASGRWQLLFHQGTPITSGDASAERDWSAR
jgi:ribonuclease HI